MKEFESIQLDARKKQPLYIQLYLKLRHMILEGQLYKNYKLPSIRHMANWLKVNTVTVVNAYKLLEEENLVYSKRGSGFYVSLDSDRSLEQKRSLYQSQSKMKGTEIIDFSTSTPSPELFPVSKFKEILNKVLDRDRGDAFDYQDIQGYRPLRNSIARYMENFGVTVDESCILVISGAQQGIDVLAKALLDFGDGVVVESPTYLGAIAAFRSRNATLMEVPIEPKGLNMGNLENILKKNKPRLIYTMPNFQNPTGYCYSKKTRHQLLALAEKYNAYIIEDDFLSELCFTGNPVQPLKADDSSNRVIYIKSFSKIFMPGLRLGFMAVPKEIFHTVINAKHLSDVSTSGLIQRAVDIYLKEEHWVSHFENMHRVYGSRYRTMERPLKKYLPPQVKYSLPQGGLHLWLTLPYGIPSTILYDTALKNNVLIAPGTVFFSDQRISDSFRLSFAVTNEEEIENGIKKLGRIINHLIQSAADKSQRNDYLEFK